MMPAMDFCRVEKRFFRALNRIVEPQVRAGLGSSELAPGSLIVLETKSRKTGRPSRIPLAAIRIGDDVVVSTFRGTRSEWVKNISADPSVRYWIGGCPRTAKAVVLSARHTSPLQDDLPAPVIWLLPFLAPQILAGWAFAVLSPNDAADQPVTAPQSAA